MVCAKNKTESSIQHGNVMSTELPGTDCSNSPVYIYDMQGLATLTWTKQEENDGTFS